MNESYVSDRIARLRNHRNVSARDMSLSIGQNENYINHIENRKSLPSLPVLFYICEYFGISLKDFFDDTVDNPTLVNSIMEEVKQLDEQQQENIYGIIKGLNR